MKLVVAFIVFVFLLSCRQNSNSGPSNKPISDLNEKNNLAQPVSHISMTDRWHFEKYLSDPHTPKLAKDIFNNSWKPKDDDPLNYLENLHGQDIEARPFYFRVVTNTYKQADGAYSEGLGNAGYEYVKKYPDEFTNYFIGQDAFTDNDLQTWADILMLEFEIISENQDYKSLVGNYLATVKNNCTECSVQQKEVLEKFDHYLNNRLLDYLKQIDK